MEDELVTIWRGDVSDPDRGMLGIPVHPILPAVPLTKRAPMKYRGTNDERLAAVSRAVTDEYQTVRAIAQQADLSWWQTQVALYDLVNEDVVERKDAPTGRKLTTYRKKVR